MKPVQSVPSVSRRTALLTMVGAVAQFAGCGGGDSNVAGLSSGGTGSFSGGTVNGLGSIIVNGIRYDDSSATVTRYDGTTDSSANLRVGMVVFIQGSVVTPATRVGGTPTAKAYRISYGEEWRGPVDATSANGFSVLGQSVDVLSTTVFDGVVSILADVTTAHYVEVYGYVDPSSGRLQATRVEVATTQPSTYRLSGSIRNLDTSARTFALGSATIHYNEATTKPALLSNGQLVGVILPAQQPVSWTATRIEAQYQPVASLQVSDKDEAEIHGVVTSGSGALFNVNGVQVDASSAVISNGTVAVGVTVEVEGTVRNGVVVASKVKVETEAELEAQEFEFHGTFSALDTNARTFVLKGYRFTYDSQTEFDGVNWATNPTPSYIEVKAVLNTDGSWRATQVEADND